MRPSVAQTAQRTSTSVIVVMSRSHPFRVGSYGAACAGACEPRRPAAVNDDLQLPFPSQRFAWNQTASWLPPCRWGRLAAGVPALWTLGRSYHPARMSNRIHTLSYENVYARVDIYVTSATQTLFENKSK